MGIFETEQQPERKAPSRAVKEGDHLHYHHINHGCVLFTVTRVGSDKDGDYVSGQLTFNGPEQMYFIRRAGFDRLLRSPFSQVREAL